MDVTTVQENRKMDEWCRAFGIIQYEEPVVEEDDAEGEYEDVRQL